jgi:hypothetical protein
MKYEQALRGLFTTGTSEADIQLQRKRSVAN